MNLSFGDILCVIGGERETKQEEMISLCTASLAYIMYIIVIIKYTRSGHAISKLRRKLTLERYNHQLVHQVHKMLEKSRLSVWDRFYLVPYFFPGHYRAWSCGLMGKAKDVGYRTWVRFIPFFSHYVQHCRNFPLEFVAIPAAAITVVLKLWWGFDGSG